MACLAWAVLVERVGRFHVQVSTDERTAYSVALGGWSDFWHWLDRTVYSQLEKAMAIQSSHAHWPYIPFSELITCCRMSISSR